MGGLPARWRRALVASAPFAVASLLAWVAMPIGSSIEWTQYAVAVGLLVVSGAVGLAAISGWRPGAAVPGGLIYLAAVGLLRNSAGGIASGAGALAIVPVFEIALYSRRRRDLALILAGLTLFFVVPTVIIGGAAYPTTQYRTTLLVLAVGGIIGAASQHLVARTRAQAAEAVARERRMEQVSALVHRLHESTSIREDVCIAARTVGEATVAIIYEPRGEGGLVSTAVAGLGTVDRAIIADRNSPAFDAFTTGTPVLIDDQAGRRVANPEVWMLAGSPDALLYEPLRRGDEIVGVLAVGWAGGRTPRNSRVAVVSLLAHEAAGVIARVDALDDLAGQARTDALTGLPNRRAWDAALERASRTGAECTVAILDLDRFKQFNDAHGHPAGDRLLKAAAAAWRDQVRAGDLLARIGGEEFGLLLDAGDPERACEAVSRLRDCTPMGQTCSAGVALREASEPLAAVLTRADTALYEAKASGRDRTCLSASDRPLSLETSLAPRASRGASSTARS